MADPRPTAERPPKLLDSYWTHTWLQALKQLKKQGSWAWEQKPLLDEYLFALRAAQDAREGGVPTQWDRHAKRAAALADQLALTARGRKAAGIGDEQTDPGPVSALDALDNVTAIRKQRA